MRTRPGEARSGGGLGEMTRRKREITGLANEQDFPHLVPRTETAVIRHFQERMAYGLFVPDVNAI
jgi:hypothetical protein